MTQAYLSSLKDVQPGESQMPEFSHGPGPLLGRSKERGTRSLAVASESNSSLHPEAAMSTTVFGAVLRTLILRRSSSK